MGIGPASHGLALLSRCSSRDGQRHANRTFPRRLNTVLGQRRARNTPGTKRGGAGIRSNGRIALKAVVPLWTASVALGLTLPATLGQAAEFAGVWSIAAAAPAQTGGSSARRAADDLIREAKAAIKRSDF